ncbi:enoyl-CoA hydratase/isomerase family protein [Gammaproteobacteria bacterium]|nr:enoyl-CoA hydratase/isomerase family protein [bacterium]MDA9340606.1 enoyl-CoA hydratase/isomerase family protein [Gammaproteobacteria bacterium]MDA9370626.1 enoyl-CoA hydratase/isomerase family protein [Gammaproteobacteria bacterium]MDB9791144.1 enoyl-CoA hydratase/isomerase family protein [Gammaproteobacteria bacterium]MDB9896071.1 enoyl-CoA hydratase/isomerase family protein [Gammaproteobacteria bacterium]|tara:strand:+ start:2079 stop:2825 length:747 start_codon:yes stop_codon:yes gene_type:complete
MSKLLIETNNQVQLLMLNRPETKNAFDAELWALFRDALNNASVNPEIHSVIVSGSNNTFSSGVDLASMIGDSGANYEEPFETCIDALINFTKPLIAAVDGVAIGGGATILLHFDAVFIAPGARIKYPFSDLGLAPEVGSSLLLFQSLGYQKAAQLLFDADWISGEEYCELGLARYCGLDFSAQAAAYASKLSEQSLASIVETKAILKTFNADVMAAARKLETTAMKKLYGSEDNLKAVEKFFARKRTS